MVRRYVRTCAKKKRNTFFKIAKIVEVSKKIRKIAILMREDVQYRVISLNCRIISQYCSKTEMLRMMNKVVNERYIIDIYSDTLIQPYFLGRGP